MSRPSLAAIIVAAGRGRRMARDTPKAFLPLAGRAMLTYSVSTFATLAESRRVVLVVSGDRMAEAEKIVSQLQTRAPIVLVEGGAERQDSVENGLRQAGDVDVVAVHDAARPFIPVSCIRASADAALSYDGAVVALPAHDTIKVVDGDRCITATPDRETIWQAQTPQTFRREILQRAFAEARRQGFVGTDDASLVERLGLRVKLVEGDPLNRKLTTPDDLRWAEWVLAQEPARHG